MMFGLKKKSLVEAVGVLSMDKKSLVSGAL